MSLPVISLWEPWSSLLAMQKKRIETRGWQTGYRGPVVIHSTMGGLSQAELKSVCAEDIFREALAEMLTDDRRQVPRFPHGHIVAVGNLADCIRSEAYRCQPGVFEEYPDLDTPQERAFGNYEPGRFGLVFDRMFRLPTPVPFKSRQGKLLELDAATEASVRQQWR